MDLKNFNNLILSFKKNSSLLFWVGLFFVFIFNAMAIRGAVQIIINTNSIDPIPSTNEIRVNFIDYHQAMNRILKAESFSPKFWQGKNPFLQK